MVFVPLSVYMCILYAGPTVPLCDLCLQPARIPVGHVLHTDHQEEGDVEHVDIKSPLKHEGHVELHTELQKDSSSPMSLPTISSPLPVPVPLPVARPPPQ